MSSLWNSIFYQPIYNILIFIINNVTFGDVGFAIILVTIIVKFALAPLTKKSIRSQILMKKMEPEIKQIKKDYPNKEEQAKIRVGVLVQHTGHPFTRGLYIPYKIDEHGYRNEHFINSLYSDFIFCPFIK